MFMAGKSKERGSTRKVTPPSPSYMTNEQFGTSCLLRVSSRENSVGPFADNARQLLISQTCATTGSTAPPVPVLRRPPSTMASACLPAADRRRGLLPHRKRR